MNYPELKIDEEKCVKCGLCVKDCTIKCLEQNDGIPQFKKDAEGSCIKCQHCLAICPTGALSIWGKGAEGVNDKNLSLANSDELFNLIKSRRSIRYYKPENLDTERMNKLKDMLKWTPTGCNFHRLHFSFVDDIEVMDDIRNKINERLIKILKNKVVNKSLSKMASYRDAMIQGEDVVFRGAPHMVIVSTPISAPCVAVDPVIALSYFELYAQSMGVGTLWCGFADACFKLMPDMCDYIGVPDGYKVSYVMLFGVPDVKYARTTQPDDFEIESVKLNGNRVTPWYKRVLRVLLNFFR